MEHKNNTGERMKNEELLQTAGIKPTPARIMIIKAMSSADHPLSMAEIGDRLETVDKSVISRTLALFKSRDLIHVIQDGSDSVRYELCLSCSHDAALDDDLHVHFMMNHISCEDGHRYQGKKSDYYGFMNHIRQVTHFPVIPVK